MTHKIKTTILAVLLSGLIQPVSAREEAPIIYSNMTTEQMSSLFKNAAFVGHTEWYGKGHKQHQKVMFRWFTATGKAHTCYFSKEYNIYKHSKTKIWPSMNNSTRFKAKYPVLKGRQKDGFVGYDAPRYSPNDGKLNLYAEYKSERKWKASRSGHLQKRIPAIVYKLCPKFPSAQSLGAEINHKQTSRDYFDLIKQDPGERIMRPELVTEDPVIRY